jgi:hypothetical protein
MMKPSRGSFGGSDPVLHVVVWGRAISLSSIFLAPDKTVATHILRSCAAQAQNNLLCLFLSMCTGLLLLNRQGGL